MTSLAGESVLDVFGWVDGEMCSAGAFYRK